MTKLKWYYSRSRKRYWTEEGFNIDTYNSKEGFFLSGWLTPQIIKFDRLSDAKKMIQSVWNKAKKEANRKYPNI